MDHPAFERGAGGSAVPAGPDGMLHHPIPKLRCGVVGRRHTQQLAIETEDERPVGPAQPGRTFDHGFEHRLQIERRAADDFEHLSGRGLLLQRLGKIARALLARFSSRTFSMAMTAWSGEGRNQRDLLVGKGSDLLAVQDERADQFGLLQHGYR